MANDNAKNLGGIEALCIDCTKNQVGVGRSFCPILANGLFCLPDHHAGLPDRHFGFPFHTDRQIDIPAARTGRPVGNVGIKWNFSPEFLSGVELSLLHNSGQSVFDYVEKKSF